MKPSFCHLEDSLQKYPSFKMMEIDCDLKKLYYLNHSTEKPWHWIFIILYSLVTISAFLSNITLLLALRALHTFKRRKETRLSSQSNILIRTPKPGELTRDLLISNLAILDIFLSLTMPFTAIDGLTKFWPFGTNTELLCRMTKGLPSIIVYSTSMIIILIAFNCYRQIIIPHKEQLLPSNMKYLTSAIIIISVTISTPQLYYTKLFSAIDTIANGTINEMTRQLNTTMKATDEDNITIPSNNIGSTLSPLAIFPTVSENLSETSKEYIDDCKHFDRYGWSHVVFCIEDWPSDDSSFFQPGRLYYSLFVFSVQLIIPMIAISICYLSVYQRLEKQSFHRRNMLNIQDEERQRRENRRCNRRNKLLAAISLTYLVSWLPLSVVSILLDASPDIFGTDTSTISTIFIICHIFGMCSASFNPIIYGYSTKKIRKGKIQKSYIPSTVKSHC